MDVFPKNAVSLGAAYPGMVLQDLVVRGSHVLVRDCTQVPQGPHDKAPSPSLGKVCHFLPPESLPACFCAFCDVTPDCFRSHRDHM